MKKYAFLMALNCVVTAGTLAQTIPVAPVDPTDSVKIDRLKKSKKQTVNGFVMGTRNDIWENISANAQLTTLAKATRSSGMIATFKSKGPVTLLAPENIAFTKMPKGRLDTLLKRRHILDMSYLLSSQAIPGRLSLDDIEKMMDKETGNARIKTLAGNIILITKNSAGKLIITDESGRKAEIIAADLEQSNGYIHVINAVIMPKARVI